MEAAPETQGQGTSQISKWEEQGYLSSKLLHTCKASDNLMTWLGIWGKEVAEAR